MNYQMLKTLLDSLVSNFRCPNCDSWTQENNLEIIWAAWTSVNLDVFCPSCQKHTFVKAEVSQINLWNLVDINPENIGEFKEKLAQKLTSINIWKKEISSKIEAKINENEILELRKALKDEHIKASDLLN